MNLSNCWIGLALVFLAAMPVQAECYVLQPVSCAQMEPAGNNPCNTIDCQSAYVPDPNGGGQYVLACYTGTKETRIRTSATVNGVRNWQTGDADGKHVPQQSQNGTQCLEERACNYASACEPASPYCESVASNTWTTAGYEHTSYVLAGTVCNGN